MVLSIPIDDYKRLHAHLFIGTSEQLTFIYCSWEPADRPQRLRVKSILFVPRTDFAHQSEYHIELADHVRPTIIKTAWDRQWCVAEAHSHRLPGARAAFSGSDLCGFREFVPHLLWRLPNRPYVALVFTERSFDALVWASSSQPPTGLEAIEIGSRRLLPTNRTLSAQE